MERSLYSKMSTIMNSELYLNFWFLIYCHCHKIDVKRQKSVSGSYHTVSNGLGHPSDSLWFNPGYDRNDFFHFFQSMGGGFLSFLWKCGPSQFIHFFHFFESVGTLNSFISFISFISLRVWGPSNLSFLSFLWGRRCSHFFHFFQFFDGMGALKSFICFISLRMGKTQTYTL